MIKAHLLLEFPVSQLAGPALLGDLNKPLKRRLRVAAWTGRPAQQVVFSFEDAKRRAFNVLFAQRILANLGLSQRFEELQNHPSRPLDLGVKAA